MTQIQSYSRDSSFEAQEQLAIEAYSNFRKLPLAKLFSERPTRTLCILNLGFGGDNPQSLEKIQEIVSQIIGVEKVVANKNWHYLYIVFPRKEFTINAKEELNGNCFGAVAGKMLFAQYVKEAEPAY